MSFIPSCVARVALTAFVAGFSVTAPAPADDCEPHWDGTVGQPGMNCCSVRALAVFDDASGAGPSLYAGGHFTSAGGAEASYVAKLDGSSWSPLGGGMGGHNPYVEALTVFDDGTGPALYAGGLFTTAGGVTVNRIAKWDGSIWSPLGSGMNNFVNALAVFDDGSGPALYAAGRFTTAGGVPANRIARWSGSSWSALGSGVSGGGCCPRILALAVFDDGTGPALYAAGHFYAAGDVEAIRIAKWDGKSWSPLSSGLNKYVNALTVFDDGSGLALYAGGEFTQAGGVPAYAIAKWDGFSWSPLGSGLGGGSSGRVHALAIYDDGAGRGPALHAGGWFGGILVNHIAKWDGTSWSSLGSGVTGDGTAVVNALNIFDYGSGSALFAGGYFSTAGGIAANNIAKWQGCPPQPKCTPPDLNCDGVVGVADLLIFLANWGPCPNPAPGNCPADLNNDGAVGVADLLILLANWG